MKIRNLIFALPVLLLIVGAFYWEAHSKQEEKAPAQPVKKISDDKIELSPEALANLKMAEAKDRQYPEQLNIMGKIGVTEEGTTAVAARVQGRIETISVTSGETVRQGQVLAKVFSPDFAATREEYLQAVKREKENSDSDFKMLAALARKKLLSLGLTASDIENLAKSDPNYWIVHAPVSGVIIDKKAVLGNAVNNGDPLFTIGDLHKVWFLGDLYPEDLPKVHPGQEVVIDPPVAGDEPIIGKVSFVSPVIDPTTRTIKIRTLMDNPHQALRGDMYIQAQVILERKQAVMIPESAIFNIGSKSYVFRQDPRNPGILERIETAENGKYQDQVTVTGINAGDIVVADGGLLLNGVLENSGQ